MYEELIKQSLKENARIKKLKSPRVLQCALCKDILVFTAQGEFKMCKCGAMGHDAGDEYMCRGIGSPENTITLQW